MRIGGLMRFSQWDVDVKKASGIMKQAIGLLSSQVDHLFVYANSLTDAAMLHFVNSLPNVAKFDISGNHFSDGWGYQGNAVLDYMMGMVDKQLDWVLFPDSDDMLPYNVRSEVQKAHDTGMCCIEFPRIETRGELIIDTNASPCGPHILGCKAGPPTPSWRASVGFNIPDGTQMEHIYHCRYPSRHLRYATPELIASRREANYYEEYAGKEWRKVEFNPDWTWDDYVNHFKAVRHG